MSVPYQIPKEWGGRANLRNTRSTASGCKQKTKSLEVTPGRLSWDRLHSRRAESDWSEGLSHPLHFSPSFTLGPCLEEHSRGCSQNRVLGNCAMMAGTAEHNLKGSYLSTGYIPQCLFRHWSPHSLPFTREKNLDCVWTPCHQNLARDTWVSHTCPSWTVECPCVLNKSLVSLRHSLGQSATETGISQALSDVRELFT